MQTNIGVLRIILQEGVSKIPILSDLRKRMYYWARHEWYFICVYDIANLGCWEVHNVQVYVLVFWDVVNENFVAIFWQLEEQVPILLQHCSCLPLVEIPGFPMSKVLSSCGATLGRNSRMLACQSLTRYSEVTSGAAFQSVFFRAILQVWHGYMYTIYS